MYVLRMLRTLVEWGWPSIIITALALVGVFYEWEMVVLAPVLGAILVIGLVVAVVKTRERQLEVSALKLRQLGGYFNRRFMGNSTLSIFSIIDSLFGIDNPQLWDWARACDMSKRIFNTWCDSFIDRMESDTRTGRFSIYLRTYLNEMWLMMGHYHEFIEQYYEIAARAELPPEAIDQYNKFVVEYNSFVQNFQENISVLKKVTRTEIEPPSVSMARELHLLKPSQPKQEEAGEQQKTSRGGGYYL